MSTHCPYVDAQGRRFRIEPHGDGEWHVFAGEDGELIGGLRNCESELVAARVFQFMSRGNASIVESLGPITATEGVDDWADENKERKSIVCQCLIRHMSGDWGVVDDKRRDANNHNSLEGRGPLLSEYVVDGRRVRIGTGRAGEKSDGDLNTVLFFEEESGKDVRGALWVA